MEHRSLAPDLIVSDDNDACGNQRAGEPAPNVAQEELRQEKQMGGAVNCSNSELFIYLQALAEGFLVTYYSDTSPSVQSKSMSIASKSYQLGKKTVVFHGFPYFQMSRNSTATSGEEKSTSSAEDSPAKTSVAPGKPLVSAASDLVCGPKWRASLAKYDPATHSLKTAQCSLLEDLTGCSVTLPRWGSMRNGELFQQPALAPGMSGKGSGFLPTPTAQDANGRTYYYQNAKTKMAVPSLLGVAKLLPTPAATDWKGRYTWETVVKRMEDARGVRLPEELCRRAGKAITPNPEFWEFIMGWPIGATDCSPLETAKFRAWRQQHGGF
ncbi:hypothetical protein UFOVP935_26 [uncultured Caudovirales phage]|uniref:Uncharacterized protein n=1 Tax=uncultured Caudovirales phage TaxID=2100421 RepID=A0A6J5PYR0_9CAUD|nr:hypothetical protein UFOVP935_26 [uncultured Caudovirales phage]